MSGAPATERWRKAAARLVTAREAMGRSGGAAAACSVLAVTMKVALALSPENAVEAPSSLTSRVRGDVARSAARLHAQTGAPPI